MRANVLWRRSRPRNLRPGLVQPRVLRFGGVVVRFWFRRQPRLIQVDVETSKRSTSIAYGLTYGWVRAPEATLIGPFTFQREDKRL